MNYTLLISVLIILIIIIIFNLKKKPFELHFNVNEYIKELELISQRIYGARKKSLNKLTDDQKYWLGVVDMRVNSLPFDFIEKTETIDSLGKGHFKEYKVNEYKIPEENREKVALTRVHGLLSIGDYITSSGSKEQRFHYESSLKGALLYATSLGINIDEK